jgi:pyruvate kinase
VHSCQTDESIAAHDACEIRFNIKEARMRRLRRCKIIGTLGPASADRSVIAGLFRAGADVFRINMSHASHDDMRDRVRVIRSLQAEFNRPIGILLDLQGPKLRIGTFAGGPVALSAGAKFVLDSDPTPGNADRVYLPHPEILRALAPGHTILIDDGKVCLKVLEATPERSVASVIVAGVVSNRKGVSLPDTELPFASLTAKDRADLDAGLEEGVDWIAVSFVQRPEDIAEVKKIARGRAFVMAKIEKPQAISRLDEIMEISDGLMVARGDLGVEMPLEQVPGLQKRITRMGRRLGKPVVVATQMLESMILSPVPTRAEVSDVATAVFEGADAVMLSAESAAGKYPIEAVAMMNKIAEEVEQDAFYRTIINAQRAAPEATGADAIAVAARDVAETLDLKAVVAWTSSGSTALRIARERPEPPILALTPHRETASRLALVWGVHAVVTEDAHDIADMAKRACNNANQEGFAEPGDRIIIVAGVPFGTPGATNMVRIAYIDA